MSQVKKFLPHQEGGDFSSQQHRFVVVFKDRTLRDDPFTLKKVLKLIRPVFSARIRARYLDAGKELSLNKYKKVLKD